MRRTGFGRIHLGDPVIGLVLSGGGSRGSFQIGALTYLYDRVQITPSVIAGSSVGSILGSALAQYDDHDGQRRVLRQLEELWRGMQQSSELFTELEWFARLRDRGPAWRETLTGLDVRRRARPLGRGLAHAPTRADDHRGSVTSAVQARVAGRTARGTARDPGDRETSDAGDAARSGPRSVPTVIELIAGLRVIARAGPDLEVILRGARDEQSFYRPGPAVDRLLDPDLFLPSRVAASGVILRVAVVGLESGELRYVTEAGRLHDDNDVAVHGAGPVELAEAIRASCAIPAIFPPVRLDGEHYVDGGTRETLPADVVLEHHRVDRCFAVVAPPAGVAREGSFAGRDILSIVLRSTAGIMSDEVLRDEVAYARSAGAVVIAPELDIHDGLTVEPGLTALAMDYGYVRAAEAVLRATPAEQAVTRDLFTLRQRIWAAEAAPADADGDGPGDPTGTVRPGSGSLATLKRDLQAIVARVPPERLPPGADLWSRRPEGHAPADLRR
jgi:predicted acylesterase/phospholipase RssA